MKQENIFIAHPKNKEEFSVLKAFMKALKIKFEIAKEDSYKPEFVEKILEGKRQIDQGNFTEVKNGNIKSFIDNL
jgi:hypothetical protein